VILLQIKKFKNCQPLLVNFGKNCHPYGQHLAQPTAFFTLVGIESFKNFFGSLVSFSSGNLTPVTLDTGTGVGRGTAGRGRAGLATSKSTDQRAQLTSEFLCIKEGATILI